MKIWEIKGKVTKSLYAKKICRKSPDLQKKIWSRIFYSFEIVQIFSAIRADSNFSIFGTFFSMGLLTKLNIWPMAVAISRFRTPHFGRT